MISEGLLRRLYEAASIQRWNDHARPFEIVELDKQAHKFVIAYVIGKFEEDEEGGSVDWTGIIEGGLFEFLHRVILTDIKPPVFHRMMERKGRELNTYVLEQIRQDVIDLGEEFFGRFERYLFDAPYRAKEKRILRAAHYLATQWEFRIIHQLNPFIHGIERTREEIEERIESCRDLTGVKRLLPGASVSSPDEEIYGFIDLCGQLRFQRRWSGVPRIPRTSVLGHMLIVAITVYLCSLEIGACDRRRYGDFFCGLFHDLPEVLTRDIISPVKQSVEGLREIIKEYEQLQVEDLLLPLLPPAWRDEMKYFIIDEFSNRVVREGRILKGLSEDELAGAFNRDEFFPIDGALIRACDELAAFLEAHLSIEYGIRAPHLLDAVESISVKYRHASIGGIDIGRLFDLFLKAGED
jgi:putative hydrolase of HD superfamily